MTTNSTRTALVTGANAGLGFEAAAQLSEAGWGRVILACRSQEKAQKARAALVERTGRDPFGELVIDTSEVASAHAASDALRDRGEPIDFLLLNAGASSAEKRFNSDKIEITYASTLIGHHVMTMRLLEDGVLSPKARIVIAGSEGARGNLAGMRTHDIATIADESYGGDRAAAIQGVMRLEAPQQKAFINMNEYVTAKLMVAWWAAALARRLPAGMTANAVSPGAAPSTSFARDASATMRWILLPAMKLFGPFVGMSGSTEQAARRYLDAADLRDDETGHFYATARRTKVVGPMGIQTWPAYFTDQNSQEAGFEALVALTGVGFPELRHAA